MQVNPRFAPGETLMLEIPDGAAIPLGHHEIEIGTQRLFGQITYFSRRRLKHFSATEYVRGALFIVEKCEDG